MKDCLHSVMQSPFNLTKKYKFQFRKFEIFIDKGEKNRQGLISIFLQFDEFIDGKNHNYELTDVFSAFICEIS